MADLFAYPQSLGIIVPIPRTVLQDLRTPRELLMLQNDYFHSIHEWMPVVSKRLFNNALNNYQTEPRADLALLLLCMKLIISLPDPTNMEGTRTELYSSAKSLHQSIQIAGRYSTRFLQSGLLITLYELGHAIYPEAQASVALNARLGVELGIHDLRTQKMNPSPATWAEEEERARTWWGIMILDR
jgi:hypothetical protein